MCGVNHVKTPKLTEAPVQGTGEYFKNKTYGGKNKQDCRCRRKGEYRCGKLCKKAHKDFKKTKKATKMLIKKPNMKKRTLKYRGGVYRKKSNSKRKSRRGGCSKKEQLM